MVKRVTIKKKHMKYEVIIGVEPDQTYKHIRTKKIFKTTEESQRKENLKKTKHEDIFKSK